ncbi:23S rRNA methyltransferase [Ignatzschineria indica]|uniref:RNA methyltransferase n=1 Tax=Ignatzschineria indica TaxID=472583 RepID=A0A2U2AMA3_9GAMM|nr:RNA methyltransferase [Ignatzschineria indica]PWD84305.1 RNA methyltransferase [Ignatzschineria indica]GGZ75403.1 23S rRNA methyltransferase [Ignatzschineria indica]
MREMRLKSVEISSPSNPRVKGWRKLEQKRERDREGLYLIEGFHLLEEALLNDAEIESILYSEVMVAEHPTDWQKIKAALEQYLDRYLDRYSDRSSDRDTDRDFGQSGSIKKHGVSDVEGGISLEAIVVSESIIKSLADTATPQGVIALVRQPKRTLEDFLIAGEGRPSAHLLLLDSVQDPGNVGTMIRTAEAAGFQGVILGEGSADLYNPKSIRATQGALFQIPILTGVSLPQLLPLLHKAGYHSWVTTLDEAQFYSDLSAPARCALVMGNEGQGVSPTLLAMATQKVKIPMLGATESLNVGVAAGILIYHLLAGNRGA